MNNKRCYLGIDLGTSSLKVGLFSPQGHRLALASHDVSTYYPQPGWAEQRPAEWWDATCAVIRNILRQSGVKPESIASVGLSAHTPANVLLDSDDGVLAPALFWADLRATEQWERISRKHNLPHAYCLPPRLLWLHENMPEAVDRAEKLLGS